LNVANSFASSSQTNGTASKATGPLSTSMGAILLSLGARRGGQSPQQFDHSMHNMVTISHTNRGYYISNAILDCFGIVLCSCGGLWSWSTRCASHDLHVDVDAIQTRTHMQACTSACTHTHTLLLLCMCVRQHPVCANFSSVASDAHPHLSDLNWLVIKTNHNL